MTTGDYTILRGHPYPLGATWDGAGVNFALFSENAEKVELCIFDQPYGAVEVARLTIRERTEHIWHCYVPEARPGLMYGYRVYGPYDPANGHRFNHHKLLLDPYAKSTTGLVSWSDAMFGYPVRAQDEDRDLRMEESDSAAGMPKSVVVDSAFDWGDDRPPRTPLTESVIYECHVKGLTYLHPNVPQHLRGTYAGLADANMIRYLLDLGVTAVELLPVHQYVRDRMLLERHLTNYWGYNTIAFFAPDPRLAATKDPRGRLDEFKGMVKLLHAAGLEVILDVVYNHTAEGNQYGSTLCFRGIDNRSYYRLLPDDERFYMDFTGTGNTLNTEHPRVLQLVMDSLRYWAEEMHVDGFRFDLASTLGREANGFDRGAGFFDAVLQDPVLSRVKLIAEPWDAAEGGYQVGNFPAPWSEWNGRYRDTVRRFWRGDPGQVPDLAYRLTGSSDLYADNGRPPTASINFVTAHDGFTLRDLVSYDAKHNEANGEDNRDGTDDNVSFNFGVEGETDDAGVIELRARQMRNLLTTLLLSQGVPMLLYGDELGRTQGGNNNAYNQDNETSWADWDPSPAQRELLEWTRTVLCFRREHPVFHRRYHFQGRFLRGIGAKDICWLQPDGQEMTGEVWTDRETRSFAMWLSGSAPELRDDAGNLITDDTVVVLFNARDEPVEFRLPPTHRSQRWRLAFDTARPRDAEASERHGLEVYGTVARSIAVLWHPTEVNATAARF